LGRIILTSSRDPCSPEGQPFAFVNALVVEPNILTPFVPPKYAHCPVPFDGAEDVPVDVTLVWKQGGYAEKHDVYFGTDEAKVTDANRSNPLDVLVSLNHSTTTYTPPEFLDLNSTYYWRIDEVNAAPDYTIFKGEVWSFRTLPYFVVDNFNSYGDDNALRNVWKDGSTNGTSAEVSVETTIVRNGNSMRYWYKNNLLPYYSEAYVDIADLGIDDPDWLGIGGAEALVLRFHVEPNNPFSEQMYVKLTDGDSPAKTVTVMYSDTTNVRLKQWNEWSIALTEFADVNLANVKTITIGFGDDSPGDADTVYFEDITLGKEIEELPEVTGEVNVNTVYQQLEGFGGAAVYDCPTLVSHTKREEIYDLLFKELGIDILRIRNTYGYSDGGVNIDDTATIIAEAREAGRSPNIKTLLTPWSPAAYLKSNDNTDGGGTLKGGPSSYVYGDYAQWWYNSLLEWVAHGVVADIISIQNEPDQATTYDSCRFDPTENPSIAGYDKAYEAVWNKLNAEMGSSMPKMWAVDHSGYGSSHITALVNRVGSGKVDGFNFHLYGAGSYDDPDGMITGMNNFRTSYGYKPLHMTEYVRLDTTPNFDMAWRFAWHIYNCLYYARTTSYFNWTLFRGTTSAGGIVTLDTTSSYIIRPQYWFLKAYSHFTDPGWYVVGTSVSGTDASNLRMSAFKSPDSNQLTVVILNKSTTSTDLTLTLNGFTPCSSEIYRSSETENWLYLGPYSSSLTLPAYSITTIHMTRALKSDISGDCYVNYEDLEIITDYWLNTECDLYDDCEGADFEPDGDVDFYDFSKFAMQWLWCNDPDDTGCVHNW
jgi:O-glycosyl hydrolase